MKNIACTSEKEPITAGSNWSKNRKLIIFRALHGNWSYCNIVLIKTVLPCQNKYLSFGKLQFNGKDRVDELLDGEIDDMKF